MLKLYKRIDRRLAYWEAWINEDEGTIVEHWGFVGETGDRRDHPLPRERSLRPEALVKETLREAIHAGYAAIPTEEHARLVVEFPWASASAAALLAKRHELEDRLNETLGWTGLGACDGGSAGSGTMEVCCLVVDYALAQAVVAADLKNTKFGDYTRIYDGGEQGHS